MLTVFGSTAYDTIRTPTKTLKNVLGGAATYAAISSSNFVKTGLIAVVGDDFSKKNYNILAKYLDLQGLVVNKGKTFRYDGKYDSTLSTRSTLKTELNVLENFKPVVPEEYKKSQFVYLANNDPEQNTKLLKEFDNVKFSMCDTIDFWISTKRDSVIKMIKNVDAVVINDEEAKLLTKECNLIKCAKKIKQWGAKYIIIKKGEHGSLMFFDDVISKPKEEENLLTDENGESINLKKEKKEKINKNNTVITPVLPSEIIPEKTEAQKLAEKFKKNTGKNSGGIGNNEAAGENGSPNGNPFKNGTGGEGSGNDNGNGNGNGPGSGIGKGGFGRGIGVDLKGRAVVKPPKLPSDTKEEGKVVVEITVDSEGNVIEANPNGRGTNASSALRAKAKHAALATKFNVDGKFEEQQGIIIIVFSFD